MCGIVGQLYFDREQHVDPYQLRAMCDIMRHRGPDDEGRYCEGAIGLGMRRLNIIDLDGGKQPIWNEDGSVGVVYNGEIYNYRELRRDLQARGHQFHTQSDTEVIVHLYEERGEDFLQDLNGMFAIALWDCRTETLILARDRFGEKPLHYRVTDRGIAFASEMKSILCTLDALPAFDVEAVYQYFLLHYIPAPLTIYRGIRKLMPGHYLRCAQGQIQEIKYWDFSYEPDEQHDEAYFVEGVRARLEDAVRLRLVSDVPLGAFLSGGIDSSIVVGLMSRLMDRPVQTFSIGFEEAQHDESRFAEQAADAFGADHHAQIVKASAVELLHRLVWHCDEPFADSSALPTFLLSEMTRRSVTVALSGDGGDELFGGYDRYERILRRRQWSRWPKAWRRQLAKIGQRLPRHARGKAFLQSLPLDDYPFFCLGLRPQEVGELLSAAVLAQAPAMDPYRFASASALLAHSHDQLAPFLYFDAKVYLPDDILVKVDRMSMAHGLETRQPFLDHRLVEFVARMPSRFKVRRTASGYETKYLLKKAFRDLLPPVTRQRRKHGFTLPVDHWFRHELRDMVHDLLAPAHLQSLGLFESRAVSRLVHEHIEEGRNHKETLWALMVFMLWHQHQAQWLVTGAMSS